MDDQTGFKSVPSHYAGEREVIDVIHDALGDAGFIAFCQGQVIKYTLRAGKKPGTNDDRKAAWYNMMVDHVKEPLLYPDPRSYRGERA